MNLLLSLVILFMVHMLMTNDVKKLQVMLEMKQSTQKDLSDDRYIKLQSYNVEFFYATFEMEAQYCYNLQVFSNKLHYFY